MPCQKCTYQAAPRDMSSPNRYNRSVFANSDMRINMQFVEKLIQERCIEA